MKLRSYLFTCPCSTAKVGISIVAMLHTTLAAAQVSDPKTTSNEAAQESAAGAVLAEIVVTAQKRAERLQDVPVTVSAITPETLAKAGVESTAALVSLVPGLNQTVDDTLPHAYMSTGFGRLLKFVDKNAGLNRDRRNRNSSSNDQSSGHGVHVRPSSRCRRASFSAPGCIRRNGWCHMSRTHVRGTTFRRTYIANVS